MTASIKLQRSSGERSHKLFQVIILLLGAIMFCEHLQAQPTGRVKGKLRDKASERPIAGVSVKIEGTSIGTVTDSLGNFILNNTPVGRHNISFSSVGYQQVVVPEVLITSGKEVFLDIALEQLIASLQQVTVRSARTRKGNASNEYAGSSSRSFSMDEVTRYAGGRNDPARLASNFAGVSTTDDSRNDIVVRGNSPSGVLWRMEGIPIPNPNHFASFGTTGGSVSAINTNALKTSDFYTGAFSAEYGNATAAVFDLSLRSGNRERFEKTIQLNLFSGLEAMLEGPIGKN
ncbi:MAG TPA: TonB-dependent receptor, partial [Flavitalea sp.]|nr:TonB-dependent receptor [Flavitalea sp.]